MFSIKNGYAFILIVYFTVLNKIAQAQNLTYIREARSSLELICSDPFVIWMKTPNLFIGEAPMENEHFSIQTVGVSPNRKRSLIIKKLNSTDVGYKKYYSAGDEECYFNLFVYDLENQDASLVINDKKYSLNDSIPIEAELGSFEKLNFFYQQEALPLSELYVNNKQVDSINCSSTTYPWLKCLQADLSESNLIKRCQTSLEVQLGYDYAHADEYENSKIDIDPINITQKVNFLFPPKVKYSQVTLNAQPKDSSILLTCDVECGNPNKYTYKWTIDNDTVLYESDKNNTFLFEFNTNKTYRTEHSSYEVTCTVSNSISNEDYLEESQTVFLIEHKDNQGQGTTAPTTTVTTPTTTPQTTLAPIQNTTAIVSNNNCTHISITETGNGTSVFEFMANIYSKFKIKVTIEV